jgi:alkanesulfonate monooxygenase SsuD/methylene tetrahydromethanopterin reductase-like flavin-dependent oxidoreductase (luciferase family)
MTPQLRAFRFGVVATPHGGGAQWLATAHRTAALGYSTLLMPDLPALPAPFPSLAIAAGVTGLTVGTFVLASPLRPARSAAAEAHSMSVLTDGRFELGIGTGLPSTEQTARMFGLPYGTPSERLARVAETIDYLRELDGEAQHTPVLMAAGGPLARALAAARADTVTIAASPLTSRADFAARTADVRARAGDRAGQVELAMSLFVVGDHFPPQAAQYIGASPAELVAADSLALLRGSVQEMADELQRRRDLLGVSYITVSAAFSEQLAPVAEKLTGR